MIVNSYSGVLCLLLLAVLPTGCADPQSSDGDKIAFVIDGVAYTSAPDLEAVLDRRAPEAESFTLFVDPDSSRARQAADKLLMAMVQRFPDTPGRIAMRPAAGLPPPEGEKELRIVVRPRN